MGDAASNVEADNVLLWINPGGSGGRGAGEFDSAEGSMVEQEAILDAAGNVAANDIALWAGA
jgi:hypothetical protein